MKLAEVELAFLDGHFDLMDLVPRLGAAGDGAHQRFARIGQCLLVRAHLIRFFLSLLLQLIGDLAQPVALRARRLQRAGLLIEKSLLFRRLA